MKLLFVIDSLGSGGAQRQMVGLAIGLKNKGYQVSFLTYHKLNFFLDVLKQNEIDVYTISEGNYLLRTLKFRKFIRNNNFTAVIAFLSGSCFMAEVSAFPWKKWKLIVGERSANPTLISSPKWRLFRLFHNFADYIVANSYENIRMIKSSSYIINSNKLKVIYNLVDLNKWSISSSYQYSHKEFKLIVVSSHQYLKNLKGLINAVSILNEYDLARLKIEWYGDVQDTSYEEGLTLIKELSLENIFSFYSATPDILQKIQSSDALGLFSFYEGLPNAVCEAMSCGKPVITSNISDLKLILKDERFLFNPKSTESIANSLSLLLKLNQSELLNIGLKNREIANDLFNADKIVEQYTDLLK